MLLIFRLSEVKISPKKVQVTGIESNGWILYQVTVKTIFRGLKTIKGSYMGLFPNHLQGTVLLIKTSILNDILYFQL
jgi:hypothetical protein